MPITIVDSQVHIWAADRPDRPWPRQDAGNLAQRARLFALPDLQPEMRAAGIDLAVIVPPTWEGLRNDVACAPAQAHPDKFAVMGRLALDDSAVRQGRCRVHGHRQALWSCAVSERQRQARVGALVRGRSVSAPGASPLAAQDVRCVWPEAFILGSDLTRMPCSYSLCVRLFTEELRWLSGDDLEWIMGRAICETLGWPIAGQP